MPEAAAHKLQETVDQITGYSRRTRKLFWEGSVVVAVFFAVVVFLYIQVRGAADANSNLVLQVRAAQSALRTQQAALHAAQLTVCGNGNIFRENQIVIWRDFIGLVTKAATAPTAKAEQEAAGFLGYVGKVNHVVNCTTLYGK